MEDHKITVQHGVEVTSLTGSKAVPPPSDDDLRALESIARSELPEIYKRFLQHVNGGYPQPKALLHVEGGWSVNHFFAVSADPARDSVLKRIMLGRGLLKAQEVPIADDGSGNMFVLNCHDGSVSIVSHDPGERIFVARSFDEFLSLLR